VSATLSEIDSNIVRVAGLGRRRSRLEEL